jgi:translation initiation factor 1
MKSRDAAGGLVYSTDVGRTCPACRRAILQCQCRSACSPGGLAPSDGVVRVARETRGRKGKGVTVVRGLPLDDAALAALAGRLKMACGCGGTVKDGVIEVQGEHRERVMLFLQDAGWSVKRAGG